jgi:hypothetical protein
VLCAFEKQLRLCVIEDERALLGQLLFWKLQYQNPLTISHKLVSRPQRSRSRTLLSQSPRPTGHAHRLQPAIAAHADDGDALRIISDELNLCWRWESSMCTYRVAEAPEKGCVRGNEGLESRKDVLARYTSRACNVARPASNAPSSYDPWLRRVSAWQRCGVCHCVAAALRHARAPQHQTPFAVTKRTRMSTHAQLCLRY